MGLRPPYTTESTQPVMDNGKYQRTMMALYRKIEAIKLDQPRARHRLGYLYASANILHLFPDWQKHSARLYRDVLFSVHLARLERKMLSAIEDRIQVEGALTLLEDRGKVGRIFCSFHVGSCYAGFQMLARLGLPVTAAVSPMAYVKLGEEIRADVAAFCANGGYALDFELISLGDPSTMVGLARRLRQGRNIAIFVDASFGTDKKGVKADGFELSFLAGRLRVRTGAAELAYLTGAKMVPVISYRKKDGNIKVIFRAPILPDAALSRKEFGRMATGKLFSILENQILKTPAQWEGWLYCHDFLVHRKCADDGAELAGRMIKKEGCIRVNHERYGFLYQHGEHWAFDRYGYRTLRLSVAASRLLKSQRADLLNPIGQDDLLFLFQQRILVYDN